MDFVAYAEYGIDLANADVRSAEDLRRHLDGRPWLRDRVRSQDAKQLAPVTRELNGIIDASASGDETRVVDGLNRLLATHPVRPRISGHDASTWHLHVNEADAPVAEILIGEALFGLALLVTELGAIRFGRCAATGCDRAFVDTTTNRSRRFCSSRCATRTNVAEYRRRRSGAADVQGLSAQTSSQ